MANTVRYSHLYRPPSSFTLPRGLGWTLVERPTAPGTNYEGRTDLPRSAHAFGVFTTDRPLTEDELTRFEIEVVQ